jgi:hypothetical protein
MTFLVLEATGDLAISSAVLVASAMASVLVAKPSAIRFRPGACICAARLFGPLTMWGGFAA